MSVRETFNVYCSNTHREVIGLFKRHPVISDRNDVIWKLDFIFCSGQPECGRSNDPQCPFNVRSGKPFTN